MRDWNVVVTANEDGYNRVRKLLQRYGKIASTEFYNVLVMRVADRAALLEDLGERVTESPGLMNDISRVVPAEATFNFQSAAEFEEKAREVAIKWASDLAGQSFHVRLHRRGFKGKLSSPEEERFLDDVILERLLELGAPGHIEFGDPDKVVNIETVGGRAGMSIWSRQDLRRWPFLHVD